MSIQQSYATSVNELLSCIKDLYKKNFEGKAPLNLHIHSKYFLSKYPKNFFFRTIEIKSYSEKADKDLNNCFPGNFFPDDNDAFKCQIYTFLKNNIVRFEDNDLIIKGIKGIINNLKPDSLVKKYTSLIDVIAKNFNEENMVLCELLASNPFKYKELVYLVDSNLNLSPLPKTAVEFYSLNQYSNNKNKFSGYLKDDPISKLKDEFLKKFNEQDQKILSLNEKLSSEAQTISLLNEKLSSEAQTILSLKEEISQLKEDSKATKYALFQVQIRDVIKAFVNTFFWIIHFNKTIDDVSDVKEALIDITGAKNEGVEMILNMLENLKALKDSGDNEGHHVNNIGFDEKILPEEIKKKYSELKIEPNCGIKDCDCIALLLSIKEINDSFPEITKKKYDLLKKLFDIPVKDWTHNKLQVKNLLNSYEK